MWDRRDVERHTLLEVLDGTQGHGQERRERRPFPLDNQSADDQKAGRDVYPVEHLTRVPREVTHLEQA
jgi:hypothetical protein